MKKYDVAVIGGGFAGVGAAIAAAREGCKVILIEKGNALGGAAVNSLVNPFMPHYAVINGEKIDLAAGIFKTIKQKLFDKNATLSYVTSRKLTQYSFMEEELKFILNDMILDAGIDLLFHAYICEVKKQDDKIQSITFATKSGLMSVDADYFIDATGDAQVSFLAGVPTKLGRESDNLCQPMTLCFRVGNVDTDKFLAGKAQLNEQFKKAVERGEITIPRENILVCKMPTPNTLHFNSTRVVKLDPTNPVDVSKAEVIARKQVYELYR